MVEGVQSSLQLEELKEAQSRYLTRLLRYRLRSMWKDGFVPWTVVLDMMDMESRSIDK